MRIEIKSVKQAAFASHETSCFECKVFVDGKFMFHAENDGHGGPNLYLPVGSYTHADIKKVIDEAAKIVDTDFEPLDLLIAQLMDKELTKKQLTRYFKKGQLTFLNGRELRTTKTIPEGEMEKYKAIVMEKYPQCVLLNFMDIEEAVDLVIKTTTY